MTILLLVLLLIVLAGGFGAWHTNRIAWPDPVSILLLVLVIVLIIGIAYPHFGRLY